MEKYPDFSINIPCKELVEEVLFCGQKSGRDVNKFEECGLGCRKGTKIDSPVLDECMVNLEIKKTQKVEAGDHVWFLGEVVHAQMESCADRDKALLYWSGEFRLIGDVIRRR